MTTQMLPFAGRPPTPDDNAVDALNAAAERHRLASARVKALLLEQKRGPATLFAPADPTPLADRLASARAERTAARKALEACQTQLGQPTINLVPTPTPALTPATQPVLAGAAAPVPVASLRAAWADLVDEAATRPAADEHDTAIAAAALAKATAASVAAAKQVHRLTGSARQVAQAHVQTTAARVSAAERALADATARAAEVRAEQERWDRAHIGIDAHVKLLQQSLLTRVTAVASGVGRDWMVELPPTVDESDLRTWLEASSAQLAYRERYGVTAATFLGPEPWAQAQKAEYDAVREQLSDLGVRDVTVDRHVNQPAEAQRQPTVDVEHLNPLTGLPVLSLLA